MATGPWPLDGGVVFNNVVAEIEICDGVFPLVASLAALVKHQKYRERAEYKSAAGGRNSVRPQRDRTHLSKGGKGINTPESKRDDEKNTGDGDRLLAPRGTAILFVAGDESPGQ
ncbi:hypothetical protein ACRALDRAFT_1060734 [Sodiomyces alcalophilus JCM 7366]|uniref:uncharacterized protein n=1 Tax=Sodiomyces alcalophilus JCM 7366 TaxID=591952 RepID=UPI0039B6A2BF